VIATAALVVGGAAAGGAVWIATRAGPARVMRTTIQTSGATALVNSPRAAGSLAITPDGSRIVYTAAGQLVVRRLDQFEATPLISLGSPTQPFISPDGQWVGFFDGMVLKKVAMTGGLPVTVFGDNNPMGGPLGATWGADGTIVYAESSGAGLRRVSAGGGEAETLTTPDRAQGEIRHARPEFLPGGRALLFTISYAGRGPDDARIAVLDLETGAKTVLLTGRHAKYLRSGHLVYGTEDTLRAVVFDLEQRTVVGAPVALLAPVAVNNFQGAYEYDVADDGTIVYLSANVGPPATRTLVWVDRQGRETPLGAEAQSYVHPRLAPDGTRVAVVKALNIWIWDLARARLTAGTLDGGTISIWTPDSSRIIFSSVRGGGSPNLYAQAADGTGTATRLTDSPNPQYPTGITPDATQVVLNEATPAALADIRLLTMTPTPQVKPLVETRFDERGGVVSPDGRWLAYESNRSGAYEVYVQPFPDVDRGLWLVSTGGGTQPLWARNGGELFYVAPDGALMGAPVEARGSVWWAGPAMRLVEGRYFSGGQGTTVRQYDVSADGQRFLMMKIEARDTNAAPSINVVQNWFEELKQRVPTN
jgi:serine/threonine-protein kinase